MNDLEVLDFVSLQLTNAIKNITELED